jgi:hypothetical protein
MNRLLLLLVMLLHATVRVDAQTAYIEGQMQNNTVTAARYSAPRVDQTQMLIYVPCMFAQSQLNFWEWPKNINDYVIEQVTLVYTKYRQSEDFNQQQLNRTRTQQLLNKCGAALKSPMIVWEQCIQTGANSPEEGRDYFHGFVLLVRKPMTREERKTELTYIDSLTKLYRPGSSTTTASGTTSGSSGKTTTTTSGGSSSSDIRVMVGADGSIIRISKKTPEDSLRFILRPSSPNATIINARYGDTTRMSVVVTERFQNHTRMRYWKLEEHKGGPFIPVTTHYDSVVITSTQRNKFTNYIVVVDVTGSMSPFASQVLLRIPNFINDSNCRGFVFFNDGDEKSGGRKEIGKTGGVYWTTARSYDSIARVMHTCMYNGTGGDTPENNLEAIITGLNKINPECEVVLIADNHASPRDLSLFKKIENPVHVVLCTGIKTTNPDYLFLARVTKGSLHNRDYDIYDLHLLKEGETIAIGPQKFIVKDNHFVLMH